MTALERQLDAAHRHAIDLIANSNGRADATLITGQDQEKELARAFANEAALRKRIADLGIEADWHMHLFYRYLKVRLTVLDTKGDSAKLITELQELAATAVAWASKLEGDDV